MMESKIDTASPFSSNIASHRAKSAMFQVEINSHTPDDLLCSKSLGK